MRSTVRVLVFLSYFLTATNSEGIYCYKCTSLRPSNPNETSRVCSEFDWSERFQVYCPKSTQCMKKMSSVPIGNKTVTKSERGCAAQKQKVIKLNDETRKWDSRDEVVENIYSNDCSPKTDIGRPGEPSEYCYCNSNLCNKSHLLKRGHPIVIFLLILCVSRLPQ